MNNEQELKRLNQSYEDENVSYLPLTALRAAAKIMTYGTMKYGEDNYLSIPWRSSADHMILHGIKAVQALKGELPDDDEEQDIETHLAHAACRALIALECHLRENKTNSQGSADYDFNTDLNIDDLCKAEEDSDMAL